MKRMIGAALISGMAICGAAQAENPPLQRGDKIEYRNNLKDTSYAMRYEGKTDEGYEKFSYLDDGGQAYGYKLFDPNTGAVVRRTAKRRTEWKNSGGEFVGDDIYSLQYIRQGEWRHYYQIWLTRFDPDGETQYDHSREKRCEASQVEAFTTENGDKVNEVYEIRCLNKRDDVKYGRSETTRVAFFGSAPVLLSYYSHHEKRPAKVFNDITATKIK